VTDQPPSLQPRPAPRVWVPDSQPGQGACRQGPGVPVPEPPRTSGIAAIALTYALLSFGAFPIVGAVIALFLADSAATELRASPRQRTGLGMVTAARILAWVHLGIVAVVMVLWIVEVFVSVNATTGV